MIEKEIRPIPEGAHLSCGSHSRFEEGYCAMELVSWMAREPFSDAPQCSCPVLSDFVREWNDELDNEERDRLLIPFVPRLIGTRREDAVLPRMWLALDWLTRTCAPLLLAATPELQEHSVALGSFPALGPKSSPYLLDAVDDATQVAMKAARSAAGQSIGGRTVVPLLTPLYTMGRAGITAACAVGKPADSVYEISRFAIMAMDPGAVPGRIEQIQHSACALLERMIEVGISTRTEKQE